MAIKAAQLEAFLDRLGRDAVHMCAVAPPFTVSQPVSAMSAALSSSPYSWYLRSVAHFFNQSSDLGVLPGSLDLRTSELCVLSTLRRCSAVQHAHRHTRSARCTEIRGCLRLSHLCCSRSHMQYVGDAYASKVQVFAVVIA